MSATRIHLGQSVRGALCWSPAEFRRNVKFIMRNDGGRFTPAELRDAFMDELAQGHEVIPLIKCDNWDWKTGCKGHPIVEGES